MKNLLIVCIILFFFTNAPPIVYADTLTVSPERMTYPLQTEVFHIIIETGSTDKITSIAGALHGARVTNIFLWQIVTENVTKGCEIRLYKFDCEFTADKDMPAEITILYEILAPIPYGCQYKPIALSVTYEQEIYSAESAVLPIEEFCISLPLVRN